LVGGSSYRVVIRNSRIGTCGRRRPAYTNGQKQQKSGLVCGGKKCILIIWGGEIHTGKMFSEKGGSGENSH